MNFDRKKNKKNSHFFKANIIYFSIFSTTINILCLLKKPLLKRVFLQCFIFFIFKVKV